MWFMCEKICGSSPKDFCKVAASHGTHGEMWFNVPVCTLGAAKAPCFEQICRSSPEDFCKTVHIMLRGF